jgi:hypothetical protein
MLLLSMLAATAAAQAPASQPAPAAQPARIQSVLAAPLVKEPPAIDGKLDDKAWTGAQPLRGFSWKPKGIRYQTEAWLCRDADNLYIAARCFDDNLGELVTKFEGGDIWRNDCIEIFIVPDKKAEYFSHVVVDCAGKSTGGVWGADKWNEPVEGKSLDLKDKTGRGESRGLWPYSGYCWTVEVAIPLKAFGIAITDKSVWAFGLNREKHSYPEEISSYQGGFNTPAEYPDLVFDNRSIVFAGPGVIKNVGEEYKEYTMVIKGPVHEANSRSFAHGGDVVIAADWALAFEPNNIFGERHIEPNQDFVVSVYDRKDGRLIGQEAYRLVEGAKPMVKIDANNMPQGKFKPGPLDDPKFFPVGVWLQPAGKAYLQSLKEVGVNVLYAGPDAYPNPRGKDFLDAVAAEGMYAVLNWSPDYVEKEYYKHPAVIGWMHGDEPDQPKTGGATATAEELMADYLKMRATEPSLRVFMNLGMGVANDRFGARVAYEKYPDYCKASDAVSFDIYPCNSLGATGPERLCVVAKGVERLVQWTGGKKPVWFIIECNRFTAEKEKDSRAPTPEEFKTQVWMAITYGARGITLFCHSWYKTMSPSRIDPDVMKSLKGVFGEVQSLAEVINSPTVENGATAQASPGGIIGLMTKKQGGATYVFAVNMFKKAEKPTITVKDAPDGLAEVLFENRTVPVKGGVIADDFAPYAVHRYKIGK